MAGAYGSALYGSGTYGSPFTYDLTGGTPEHFDRGYDSEVFVVDRSGNRIAELSTATVSSIGFRLNDFGSASFSVPVSDPSNAYIELGETEVQIFHKDVMWWGRVASVRNNPTASEYQCEELLSYYGFRYVLTASLDYTSMDQIGIAVLIHEEAQTGTNRDFNIDSGFMDLSGRTRSRRYDRWQHPNILDLLKEFTEIDDGFDISVEYDATGARWFWCHYPQKGVYKDEIHLELGKNIADFSIDEDTNEIATLVYATGGTNGDIKFEENYSNDAKAASYGTRYEAVESHGDQKDTSWLLDAAIQSVFERQEPILIPEVTCYDDPGILWGEVLTGDSVWVEIKVGRVDVNNRYRVLEIIRNPQDRTTTFSLVRDYV